MQILVFPKIKLAQKKSLILCLLLLGRMASPGIAQELFSDNFDSYSIIPPTEHIPLPIAKSPPAKWWSGDQMEGRSLEVMVDAEDFFGRGADNQFLRMRRSQDTPDHLDHNLSSMTFAPTKAGSVSFDFYVRSSGFESSVGSGLILRLMSDVMEGDYDAYDGRQAASGIYITANATVARSAEGGKGGMAPELSFSYLNDQKNTLKIVFNNSDAVYGSEKLEPGHMDVYLNGEKQGTWEMGSGNAAGIGKEINGLWFQITRNALGEIYLDQVAVEGSEAVK